MSKICQLNILSLYYFYNILIPIDLNPLANALLVLIGLYFYIFIKFIYLRTSMIAYVKSWISFTLHLFSSNHCTSYSINVHTSLKQSKTFSGKSVWSSSSSSPISLGLDIALANSWSR